MAGNIQSFPNVPITMAENPNPPQPEALPCIFSAIMIMVIVFIAILIIRDFIIRSECCSTEEDGNERRRSVASSNLRSTAINGLSRPQPNYEGNGCIVWAIQDPSGGVDIYHMNNEGYLHTPNGAYSGFIGRLNIGGGHPNSGFSRGLDTISGYQDSRLVRRLDNAGGHQHSGFSGGLETSSGHQNSGFSEGLDTTGGHQHSGLSQGLDTASGHQNSGFSAELDTAGGHQHSGLSGGLDTAGGHQHSASSGGLDITSNSMPSTILSID